MSTIDSIILIVLLWGAWQGFRQGVFIALGSLVALFVGIWGAIHFSDFTAKFLAENFNLHSEYNSLIAFAVTFIMLVIGVNILAFLIDKFFETLGVSLLVKVFGIVVGVFKWLFVTSVILSIINVWNVNYGIISRESIENSKLYNPVSRVAPAIYPYFGFERLSHHENTIVR